MAIASIGSQGGKTAVFSQEFVEMAPIPTLEDKIATEARIQGVDENLALSIAKCESGTRQFLDNGEVLRGYVDPRDSGVFQINTFYHLEKSKELGFDIYTEDGNIGYAMWLLKVEGSRHWSASRGCWG